HQLSVSMAATMSTSMPAASRMVMSATALSLPWMMVMMARLPLAISFILVRVVSLVSITAAGGRSVVRGRFTICRLIRVFATTSGSCFLTRTRFTRLLLIQAIFQILHTVQVLKVLIDQLVYQAIVTVSALVHQILKLFQLIQLVQVLIDAAVQATHISTGTGIL